MKFAKEKSIFRNHRLLIFIGLLITVMFVGQSALAVTDYIFFSVNGDTTVTSMTQGDELFWGANCDMGATVNWEIWYDVNSNSSIDISQLATGVYFIQVETINGKSVQRFVKN